MQHIAYLALGTNLGDRLANLQAAMDAFAPEIRVAATSPVYETPPWGYLDQAAFLNQVVQVETGLSPEALLAVLKRLEEELGRQASIRYGPRLIDLDILFYDDLVLETAVLTIPHPRMRGRAFVFVPLADLVPDLIHPKLGLTVRQLCQETDREGINLYQPLDSRVESK
ncbi:2-amino-4-hydroxy-6-hydroxymethyldihydropteridine diphosphokinase [Chloroflexota bacterium]